MRWLLGRPGGVIVELGVAAAVLMSVAFATGGAQARPSTAPGSPAARTWSARALPVMTALADDLTAIDAAANAGAASQDPFSATRSGFLSDVGRARSLGSPGGGLDARWSSALAQVDVVAGALAVDSAGAQGGRVRAEAESAAEALQSFVASMERPSR